ncbi:MAG: flagellin [Oscillospiraceae bacterium]|nr:flagellin [Oscillospiraceae bacterium]
MVVQHNLSAMNSTRLLGVNQSSLSKNLEKLSSGYSINRAGDNAAGLAISEKMRSQIAGLNQASTNSQDGISMVQTFEGALQETDAILQRMKTLATQSANGTYDQDVDRAAIELEYQQLCDEIDDISKTDFNGVVVLSTTAVATGGNLNVVSSVKLQAGARTNDLQEFTFAYSSAGLGGLDANLNCTSAGLGLNSLSLGTQMSANEAIDKIDNALNKVSMVRATFGSIQNRLEHKIANLDVSAENMQASESRIRDTDMAKEMMSFTKNQILSQASQAMLAQANSLPQGVLSLLQ